MTMKREKWVLSRYRWGPEEVRGKTIASRPVNLLNGTVVKVYAYRRDDTPDATRRYLHVETRPAR